MLDRVCVDRCVDRVCDFLSRCHALPAPMNSPDLLKTNARDCSPGQSSWGGTTQYGIREKVSKKTTGVV